MTNFNVFYLLIAKLGPVGALKEYAVHVFKDIILTIKIFAFFHKIVNIILLELFQEYVELVI